MTTSGAAPKIEATVALHLVWDGQNKQWDIDPDTVTGLPMDFTVDPTVHAPYDDKVWDLGELEAPTLLDVAGAMERMPSTFTYGQFKEALAAHGIPADDVICDMTGGWVATIFIPLGGGWTYLLGPGSFVPHTSGGASEFYYGEFTGGLEDASGEYVDDDYEDYSNKPLDKIAEMVAAEVKRRRAENNYQPGA